MKRVLVMMSSYNGEKYISEQISSILSQKGNFDLSLIVRDDGSTDNTKMILQEYQNNNKLKWYTGKNLKPGLSFLDILHNNPGYDYYAFSDQDDIWLPNKIEAALSCLGDNIRPELYFSNAQCVNENLDDLGFNTYRREMKLDFYSVSLSPGFLGCTMVFNHLIAQFIQNKPLPKRITMHDAFLSKLCVSVGGTIIYDNNAYIKYRQSTQNTIGATRNKLDALYRRFHTVIDKPIVSSSEDAREILRLYLSENTTNEYQWIKAIANCNESLKSRARIALSNKPHFISRNLSITVRLQILFGNY